MLAAVGRDMVTEDARHFSADELHVPEVDDAQSAGTYVSAVRLAAKGLRALCDARPAYS